MIRLAVPGAALLALTWGGLALHEPGAITLPSPGVTAWFVALMALAVIAYFLALPAALAPRPPRGAFWLVIGVAAALRAPLLFEPPFLSSDMFRYVWDGKVQAAWINPYRYIPADPALAPLRDTAIYPHVNRAAYARTIYPPAAELIFALAARISPTIFGIKAMMVCFELIGMAAMLRLLARAALPPARLLVYAWNPLAVWAFAGNGHVDALAVGFVGLALLAAASDRRAVAGALAGGAVLVKFLPAAIVPALWRRWDWKLPLACAAVIVALYLPYLGAGPHVLGFLPDYAVEEGIDRGSAFWLLAGLGLLVPVGPTAILVYESLAALGLLALAGRIALGRAARNDPVRLCRNAAILGGATMLALSPHYAWYYAWLALPCCVAPLRSVIYLAAAAVLLYLSPWDEHFFWPSLVFVPALLLAVLDARRLPAQPALGRA